MNVPHRHLHSVPPPMPLSGRARERLIFFNRMRWAAILFAIYGGSLLFVVALGYAVFWWLSR